MRALALCLLVGCDEAFDLEKVVLPDALSSDGLVAWYPMEGLAGNRLEDAAGDHDGTCTTATCPVPVSGLRGGALQFDGISALIDVPGAPDFATTMGFTAAAWIRVPSTSSLGCAFGKIRGTANDNSWAICTDSQGAFVYAAGTFLSAGAIARDTWLHVVARWDTNTLFVFIDAQAVRSEMVAISFDGGAITIGGDRDNTQPIALFAGAVDDARLYNRALSDPEIRALAAR